MRRKYNVIISSNPEYMDYLQDNNHTPKTVKSKFSPYLNDDIITGKEGSRLHQNSQMETQRFGRP